MKDGMYAASVADVLRRIGMMNEAELSKTVFAVRDRYGKLFPQDEIVFLSLPKDDPDERGRIMEGVCRLEKWKRSE